jgi:hypothetical protein
MSPAAILEYTRRQPFEPFRLFLSDGTTYDIRHPEMCMVGKKTIVVGIPSNETYVFDRSITISMLHIVRLEPISATARPTAPTESAA